MSRARRDAYVSAGSSLRSRQDGLAVADFGFCLLLDGLVPAGWAPSVLRRLRIEFEGAIYHVMARGYARQKKFSSMTQSGGG
jgi:hypothetical protein